jgi:type II secretory pathway component PulK
MLARRTAKVAAQRGVVLLITLWVLIVLGLIAFQVAVEVRRDVRITGYQRDDFLARNLARSGIGVAVCDLKNDLLADFDPLRQPYDALSDIWFSKVTPAEPRVVETGSSAGSYYYIVQDEESKLNINMASLQLLHHALVYLGIDEYEAEQLAPAIVDWRDADNTPSFLNPNARDQAMNNLAERELEEEDIIDPRTGQSKLTENMLYGRDMRNENLLVLEELLDIPGITPTILYGRDPLIDQLPPDPFPVTYAFEQDLKTRRRGGRKPGLVDFFTAQPTNGLNLNTASLDALTVLFSTITEDLNQAAEMAEEVVRQRGDPDRMMREEDVFRTQGDASRLPEFSPSNLSRIQREHRFCFQSSFFTIYAAGQVNNSRSFLAARIFRRMARYQPEGQPEQNSRGQARNSRNRLSMPDNAFEEPRVECIMWLEW